MRVARILPEIEGKEISLRMDECHSSQLGYQLLQMACTYVLLLQTELRKHFFNTLHKLKFDMVV